MVDVMRHKVWVSHSHHSTDPQDLNGQLDQMEQNNQLTEEQLNTLREELVGVRGGGRGWGGGRGVGRREEHVGRMERGGEEGESDTGEMIVT